MSRIPRLTWAWVAWGIAAAISILAVADESAGTIITAVVFFAALAAAIVSVEVYRYNRTPVGREAKKRKEEEERLAAEDRRATHRARHRTWVEEERHPHPTAGFPVRPFWVAYCSCGKFRRSYLENPGAAEDAARRHADSLSVD